MEDKFPIKVLSNSTNKFLDRTCLIDRSAYCYLNSKNLNHI